MKARQAIPWIVVGLVVVYAILPLLWLLRLSVTPEPMIHQWPPALLPASATLAHYTDILTDFSFWQQLLNSLFVCIAATTVALLLGTFGAYGLARYRFRFRYAILMAALGIHLLPGMANMTAVYRIAETLRAFDSLIFVSFLKAGGVTLALWILLGAFKNVPEHLEHAAQLDGLTRAQSLWKVSLPLAGPGILTAGLLLFIQSWNTFFLPFLLLESPEKMTLTVGLYRYFSEHGFQQGHVASFMILSMVPVIALFVFFRKRLWRNVEI